jgi:hypothetical protein
MMALPIFVVRLLFGVFSIRPLEIYQFLIAILAALTASLINEVILRKAFLSSELTISMLQQHALVETVVCHSNPLDPMFAKRSSLFGNERSNGPVTEKNFRLFHTAAVA